MKIAVLSDIHGNNIALDRCLEYLKDKDIDAYCFLGDYMGEFPGVEQIMKTLYKLRDNHKCYFLRGNKENYQIDKIGEGHPEWDDYPSTVGMLRYANTHLTDEDIEFFKSLPISMRIKNQGLPDIVICHGSPRKVNEIFINNEPVMNEIVEETKADYIIFGHIHRKIDIKCGSTHIWNPGSAGASVDIPFYYQFMILNGEDGKWEPEWITLEADIDNLLLEMKNAGLYEIAPYWTRFTELLVRGECGEHTHGTFISRAIDLCYERNGSCYWPEIPEECYAKAFEEICSQNNGPGGRG